MDLTIVTPTYQERRNIGPLLGRIKASLEPHPIAYEVIIVDDDSRDGTRELLCRLAGGHPVRLITRTGQRSLATAVITGLREAKGEVAVVMDADLSHPPEKIPEMHRMVSSGESDFVLGSRYLADSPAIRNWSAYRRLNSWVATALARPLASVADPMSGFFALPLAKLPDIHLLSPEGFKIALELLVKGDFESPREIPITFTNRVEGESKLGFKEQLRYLRHLRRLYNYRYQAASEFVQFAAVGSSGLLVDIAVFVLAHEALGVNHYLARCLSFICAASSNWYLNRLITFSARKKSRKAAQWPKFLISAGIGFLASFSVYALLTGFLPFFRDKYVLALMIGVAFGLGSNFTLSHFFVFLPYTRDDVRLSRRQVEGDGQKPE